MIKGASPRAVVSRLGLAVAEGRSRYRRVLSQRDASVLLTAGIVSEIGDWFNAVALMAVAYDLGDGALGVGFMLALRMVPRLVFQGPAGVLVDRWPGRRLLALSHLLLGAIATAFLALLAVPELWLLCALVLALETVGTVAFPAFRVQVVKESPPETFAAVNAVLSLGLTAAQFVGPVLGGLVLAASGPAPVFLLNGLTYLGVAVAVTRLRGGPKAEAKQGTAAPAPPAPPAPPSREAVRGYGWLLRRTDLLLFAGAALGVTVTARGAIALFVVRSDDLGLGDGGPGYFFAAVALGSVVGGIVAGGGTHAGYGALRGTGLAMAVGALALAAFGAVDAPVLALIALVVAGLATEVYEVLALTFFQHRLPAELYGRFMAIFLIALGIGGIVGALVGPLLETTTTVAAALAWLALPGVVLALGLIVRASLLCDDR